MQKWEYQTLTNSGFDPQSRNCLYRLDGTLEANSDSFVDVLNHAGQQGWEAFAAVQDDDDSITYVLKRPTK